MARLISIIRLAFSDYRRDGLLSICAICALAAAVTPLLSVWGVRNGIVTSLTERLLENPRNLELSSIGTGRYGKDFFDALRARPEVRFVTPETRSIAAKLLLQGEKGSVQADLVPTGPGDPLMLKWAMMPSQTNEAVLSWSAAEKTGLTPGGTLLGRVSRIGLDSREERAEIKLNVIAVLPDHAYTKAAVFAWLDLLDAVEDFRNGFAVPALNWPGENRPDFSGYAGFRIAAADPAAVQRLQKELVAAGIEVYARSEDIALVQNLDRAFTVVFAVLFSVVGAGAFAAAAANALGQIARKRRSLAVLRLMGFSSRHLAIFGLIQAALTGVFAALAASGLYLVVETVINRTFGSGVGPYEAICRLDARHYAMAALASTVLMVLASVCASRALTHIEPSEALRDV